MLANKTVIITGASRGIGKEIALTFASHGANLVLNGTNKDLLEDVEREALQHTASCISIAGDVSNPKTAKLIVEEAIHRYSHIDVLVNNAGVNARSSTLDMDIEEWQRTIDINLNGNLYFSKAVLPHMIDRGAGKIINISSSTAKSGHRNASPSYGASKAAVDYLTKHLALEMAPYNITVNGLSPGPIETDMVGQWTSDYRDKVLANVPLKRLGKASDVAGAALFLASDLSSFITGETININGGTYIN
ncbi:SDR family NAD(P)-dependent oxidoreductase [Halalkalibacter hemicellulosilyticus]|uniref:3-oxoacyl-[acyl-carrier protein] reductase n=1 Tax=Halalkalibacter hemicellulosilyticusJCM 9152 TaxID=1236971 RepID=W4QI64_9BACI|nr:3-oxoacyl-ACP reductase family protein [Halalkalibacter hemicellulosilyticus]GAE31820.1 3-oxoacyl-[acyl-carrier protein] reductase [Halalkalibacter hemicellulosilyticusJCM 9152]